MMGGMFPIFLSALIGTVLVHAKQAPCTFPGYEKCECVVEYHQGDTHKNNSLWKELYCQGNNFNFEETVQLLNMSGSQTALDNMVKVFFTGNNLTVVPRNVLGNRRGSFWDLETLDLSNNGIKNISGKSFHSAPELETLILNDNEWYVNDRTPRIFSSFFELKNLHLCNAFFSSQEELQLDTLSQVFEGSELYWLEELYLERNKLERVSPKLFQSLPSLRKLSLKNNRLENIDELFDSNCHERTYYTEVFKETCVLEELDLSENHIKTIPMTLINELMKMNKTFKRLNIDDNPLHCDYEMKGFISWLKTGNNKDKVPNAEKLQCHSPKEVKDHSLLQIHATDLKGKEASGASGVTIALAVIFSILAVGLIVILVINRRMVIESTGKAIGSIRDRTWPRKYSYTGVNV